MRTNNTTIDTQRIVQQQTRIDQKVIEQKIIVYLAGPINNTENGGASWRLRVKQEYTSDDVVFIDPTSHYNVPRDDLTVVMGETKGDNEVSVEEIVERDKELLEQADAVLVGYSDVKSVGTPMEVQWAYERNYPIVMWDREPCGGFVRRNLTKLRRLLFGEKQLSVWYRYHCDYISDDIDDVLNQL